MSNNDTKKIRTKLTDKHGNMPKGKLSEKIQENDAKMIA